MSCSERLAAPVGMVGLLFTDIVGSTRLAARLGRSWGSVLADHHRLLGAAIAAYGGFVDGVEGDAFFATFADPAGATLAAVEGQRALRSHSWPAEVGELSVRMGVHVGELERQATGYVGLELHRAARVAAAAHGGQLLMTRPAALAAAGVVGVDDLGRHRFKDFPVPIPLYCARIDGRGAESFPPPKTLDARPTNLPSGPPTLFGRETELAHVDALLRVARVVTVAGRGGSGKSSLALVAGDAALEAFRGGVWWVSLSAVTDPDQVLPSIAAAVQVDAAPGMSMGDAISNRFESGEPVLVILDNMEHLLDACVHLVELLTRIPSLRLLITSQSPLGVSSEEVVALTPLEGTAALALCDATARRVGRQLPLDVAEQAEMLAVCGLLDGLPLAIELAAARLSILTPRQLRERLDRSLDLVRGGARRPDRQRSLGATLDWTLGLLSDHARRLFVRLGAFAGPVELDELELVAGDDGLDVLDAATELLEVALLTRVETGDGRLRFGMPQSLRRMASERLDVDPDGGHRRRVHARRQLERSRPGIYVHVESIAEAAGADDAEPEARLAIARVAASDPRTERLLRIALAARYSHTGRLADARAVLEPVEQDTGDAPIDTAALLFARAQLAGHSGDIDTATRLLSDSLVILGDADPRLRIALLTMEGFWCLSNDIMTALQLMSMATAEARAIGGVALAGALGMEAMTHQLAGDLPRAAHVLTECAEVAAASDSTVLWSMDSMLGDIAFGEKRFSDAARSYVRSLELADLRADVQQIAFDLSALAACAANLGSDQDSATLLALLDAYCTDRGTTPAALLPVGVGTADAANARDRLDPAAAARADHDARATPATQRILAARRIGERIISTNEPTPGDAIARTR